MLRFFVVIDNFITRQIILHLWVTISAIVWNLFSMTIVTPKPRTMPIRLEMLIGKCELNPLQRPIWGGSSFMIILIPNTCSVLLKQNVLNYQLLFWNGDSTSRLDSRDHQKSSLKNRNKSVSFFIISWSPPFTGNNSHCGILSLIYTPKQAFDIGIPGPKKPTS